MVGHVWTVHDISQCSRFSPHFAKQNITMFPTWYHCHFMGLYRLYPSPPVLCQGRDGEHLSATAAACPDAWGDFPTKPNGKSLGNPSKFPWKTGGFPSTNPRPIHGGVECQYLIYLISSNDIPWDQFISWHVWHVRLRGPRQMKRFRKWKRTDGPIEPSLQTGHLFVERTCQAFSKLVVR